MATCPECRQQFPDERETCPVHGLALIPSAVFANEDKTLEAGTVVGDYVVEAKLGEGAFGRVYRAVHPIIGRLVAIKVLNRALSTDPHAVSRFISEARALVGIASPHIVDIFSFGALPDGRQYYIMELLDGMSLGAFIQERGALEVPLAVRLLAGMADALSSAHAAKVVHRDLKPENVLIVFDRNGEPLPKLLDFGVAKLLGDRKLGHHTSTGAMVGTPAYMAPEQALGLEIDHRADIYAFGVVAFEMLTGQLPFDANSVLELIRKHTSEPPPLLSTVRPELGASLDAPLGRMLEKDPKAAPEHDRRSLCRVEGSGASGRARGQRPRIRFPAASVAAAVVAGVFLARQLGRGYRGRRVTPGALDGRGKGLAPERPKHHRGVGCYQPRAAQTGEVGGSRCCGRVGRGWRMGRRAPGR